MSSGLETSLSAIASALIYTETSDSWRYSDTKVVLPDPFGPAIIITFFPKFCLSNFGAVRNADRKKHPSKTPPLIPPYQGGRRRRRKTATTVVGLLLVQTALLIFPTTATRTWRVPSDFSVRLVQLSAYELVLFPADAAV